ncbi:methyltransferase, FxLD system [Micromonospora profundi]|uniref:methyltransferase, FxLD system n=1 Tax=Micromonospora profundi TaxID=1420889 RepID=UPI0036B29D37
MSTGHDGTGEQRQAHAFRHKLVDNLVADGTVRTEAVERALRTVPRHVFAPEATLAQAYADEAVVTKRDQHGLAISSVSAPQAIAMMLELLDVRPGHHVLEIGSGGYNAALLRKLVGDNGHVTTLDIDQYVVDRASQFLTTAGYPDVRLLCADGEYGAPDGAPYDRIIVTVGAADIPPTWIHQLAPDGRIVVPLRLRNLTRAIAFDRRGDHLASDGYGPCGFVPMQGAGEDREQLVLLAGREVGLRLDGGMQVDAEALRTALTQTGTDLWTGVTVGQQEPLDDLELRLSTALPGFCQLAAQKSAFDSGLVNASWRAASPAVVVGDSCAYRMRPRPVDEDHTSYEFGVRGHGPRGAELAEQLAEQIRTWNECQRGGPGAWITAYPADTPDSHLPEGFVIDKPHTRVTISWP